MTATPKLQGAIETIRQVIIAIGPAPARDIERHPDTVAACRSSKTKARRHIERLYQLGHIKSCGSLQQPKYWVEQPTPQPQPPAQHKQAPPAC